MKRRISITSAEEGMVLARPVMNNQGIALCAEGTPLTGDLIERLTQMEVTGIWIGGEEKLSYQDYLDLRAILEKRFASVNDSNALLGKLKKVLLNRLEAQKGSF